MKETSSLFLFYHMGSVHISNQRMKTAILTVGEIMNTLDGQIFKLDIVPSSIQPIYTKTKPTLTSLVEMSWVANVENREPVLPFVLRHLPHLNITVHAIWKAETRYWTRPLRVRSLAWELNGV